MLRDRHPPPIAPTLWLLNSLGMVVLFGPSSDLAAQTARAVPALAIPGDAPGYFVNRVAAIAIASDSSILVLDPVEARIYRFDRRGRYLDGWGRQGSGPGEWRRPSTLGWRGDTLWAFDPALARLSLYAPSGGFHRSIQLPASGKAVYQADGSLATLSVMSYGSAGIRGPPIIAVRYNAAGRLADTLIKLPSAYRVLVYPLGGRTSVGQQPFEDGPLVVGALNGSGWLVVRRDATGIPVRLTRIDPAGDTLFQRAIRLPPRRLTRAQVASAVADLEAEGPRQPDLGATIEAALYKPRYLPPISDALVGEDSTIWLRGTMLWEQTIRWLVLDPHGEKLFELDLPTAFRPFVATRSMVWGAEPNESGVPVVKTIRIAVEP